MKRAGKKVGGGPGLCLIQLRLEGSFRYESKNSGGRWVEECQIQEKVLDKSLRFGQIHVATRHTAVGKVCQVKTTACDYNKAHWAKESGRQSSHESWMAGRHDTHDFISLIRQAQTQSTTDESFLGTTLAKIEMMATWFCGIWGRNSSQGQLNKQVEVS